MKIICNTPGYYQNYFVASQAPSHMMLPSYCICIYIIIYNIHTYICIDICVLDKISVYFLNAHSSFIYINAFKMFYRQKRTIQFQVTFSSLLKNLVLSSSIKWACNLVSNVSRKCSLLWHKVSETSLVLDEK